MRAPTHPRWPLPLLVALALAVAGCAPRDHDAEPEAAMDDAIAADGRALDLLATTSIIGDILEAVVDGDATVAVLMPPGTDPHQFEPTPAQVRAIEEADLVVANGFDLEPTLTDVLATSEQRGDRVLRLFDGIADPLQFEEAADEHADDDGHDDHGEWDPHVWNDPVRTAEAVRGLGIRLDEVDDSRPEGTWAERSEAYADEILTVHAEIEQMLVRVPDGRRKMVTNHDAFGYLADRYDLEVLGVIIPGGATLAEPTAREFRELAELIDQHDLPAIFAETTSPTRLAEALAREVGRDVDVVVLYSESLGEPGSGAETYLGMLRVNGERIAEALSD